MPFSIYIIRYFASDEVFTVKVCGEPRLTVELLTAALLTVVPSTVKETFFPAEEAVEVVPALNVIVRFPAPEKECVTVQIRVLPLIALFPAAAHCLTSAPSSLYIIRYFASAEEFTVKVCLAPFATILSLASALLIERPP